MSGVSVAEKRAELLAAGEEWPTYPDGTRQLWQCDLRRKGGGGHFRSWVSAQTTRSLSRARSARSRVEGGECSAKGCTSKRRQLSSGKFATHCHAHALEIQRRYYGFEGQIDAPALTRYERARRAGIARGDQILDEAIARYEDDLKQFTTPHPEVTCLTH